MNDEYLYCQTCGERISGPLTQAQQQKIAANPENFIFDCPPCMREKGYGR